MFGLASEGLFLTPSLGAPRGFSVSPQQQPGPGQDLHIYTGLAESRENVPQLKLKTLLHNLGGGCDDCSLQIGL